MVFHTQHKQVVSPKHKINEVEIEQVKEFNFLGIVINEHLHLNWKSHVEYIYCTISTTSGIIHRMKHFLPLHIKLALCNSLVLSYINYGILAWGHNSNRILKLQKRSIRITSLNKYNSHIEPIFKQMNLLQITDIYVLNELKF